MQGLVQELGQALGRGRVLELEVALEPVRVVEQAKVQALEILQG